MPLILDTMFISFLYLGYRALANYECFIVSLVSLSQDYTIHRT
jgi:hypothetical protein